MSIGALWMSDGDEAVRKSPPTTQTTDRDTSRATGSDEPSTAQASATEPPIPWMGIVAVLIGLSISIFFGNFLSSGLPDLRGALHLSVDQGAWLGAAFNGGQMFMGPLSVYLGGLLGPRKVLLTASVIVAVIATLLPFASSYGMLLVLLSMMGLAAGTFYPLTLTYILRSAPPRLIFFGISCYTIDAIGGTHVATALESWYYIHLSWHWLFWHFSLTGLLMAVLVYLGMPPQPKPESNETDKGDAKLQASWRGFLYASLGLTTLYLALTQGERLNWQHSGVIVGLGAAGAFLLLASVVRHFTRPNPLVDLSILDRRNLIVMSFQLFIFRFVLLASATVVPQFLTKVQSYRPEQTGPVLSIVALPMFLIGIACAFSLKYVQPRAVLATGFTLIAIACLWDNTVTSAWAWNNFLQTETLMGAGLAVAIIGLVGCIVLAVINGGAMSSPLRALTVAAWFHCVRLMGGEIGAVSLTRLLDVREQFHSNMLGQSVSLSNPTAVQQLVLTSKALAAKSALTGIAIGRAGSLTNERIAKQAYTLASADGFIVIAWVLTLGLVLAACYKPEAIAFKQVIAPKKEAV